MIKNLIRGRRLYVQRRVLPQTELCIKRMFSQTESCMNRSILCGLSGSSVTKEPYYVVNAFSSEEGLAVKRMISQKEF